jgi:cytochrome c oxidase cbb3-type subunit 4
MDVVAVLGSVTTIVSMVAFAGIVAWAWSKRRGAAFDEAANAPFALPDEAGSDPRKGRRS